MQTKSKFKSKPAEGAYLTIYLSLTFGIVLSLLLALIEGATIGAVRAQAELVADLGMDSIFAEYHRELLNQYELFFIDSSYGGSNGGIGKTETHLKKYMDYNMNPETDLSVLGADTLLKLSNPYLELEEVSFASDNNGAVWKSQAVQYMKAVYGGDLISTVQGHLSTVNGNELATRDIDGELAEQKSAFEETLAEKGIVEYSSESDEGYSYKKVTDISDSLIGDGVLALAMPKGSSISGTTINKTEYISHRIKTNQANKGVGLHSGAPVANGLEDELIYGEYLMKMCGSYTNKKVEGFLAYQLEYILYGKDSDVSNLRTCVERLLALRAVSNFIYLNSDSGKSAEVRVIAAIICTLLLAPELTEILTYIILAVWALAEAVVDVRTLLDNGKVPLLKNSSDWCLGLTNLFDKELSGSKDNANGLSYQDYLRIFLGLMDKKDKVLRILDIVEMDMRKTQGNENFRIDQCIDYIKADFGFMDAQGHEFVFQKKMCYE